MTEDAVAGRPEQTRSVFFFSKQTGSVFFFSKQTGSVGNS
jgi:hypothetical protein